MKAVVFDTNLSVREIVRPVPASGEVLIKVAAAGICNTDLEITKGYVPGFRGVLGHEFWGYIDGGEGQAGNRVTAEINCACGQCEFCTRGLGRHCPNRTVIGIVNRPGAFAEYITVPRENVFTIPDHIPDSSAIFIEPLAAALEILDQVEIDRTKSVLLLGDGKLAQLVARVLTKVSDSLTVVGKHEWKLALMAREGIQTVALDQFTARQFDVVVEASGSPAAFDLGISSVKPRGTFVLKSTYAGGFQFSPATVVVNEITLIGSRCGRFAAAIDFLTKYKPDLSPLITSIYGLQDAPAAFAASTAPDAMKVVLECCAHG